MSVPKFQDGHGAKECDAEDTTAARPILSSRSPRSADSACDHSHHADHPVDSTEVEDGDSLAPLVAIVGPTASGKSELAVFLAERVNGEIVNYDSVQLYRGMDIGSGKIAARDRAGIPHHLLDVLELDQARSAGLFRCLAMPILQDLRRRGKVPILAGGTGLYLRALLDGLFDGPARSPELRRRLQGIADRFGVESLHRVLRRLDPKAARRIHAHDTPKLIRAAEVCFLSGRSLSALQERGRDPLSGFFSIKVGLNPERLSLIQRINDRVESMFASGILEECRAALEQTNREQRREGPLGALGYRQAFAMLRGELNLKDAIRLTQSATRQYAKRQMTWLRRESDVTWFQGFGSDPDIQRQVATWLASVLNGFGGRITAKFPVPEKKVSINEYSRK